MPKIEEHAKNILRLRKGEERLFWILHKIMEIVSFSVYVHQCNIAFSVQLCFKFFYLLFFFFQAKVAAN